MSTAYERLMRHISIRYLKIVSTAEAIYTFAS